MSERRAKIRSRIWIDIDDTPYLGEGRILLLEQILKHGSITKGAEAINMSYRKAWQLVENMNKTAPVPLVEKRLGGAKGGGAEVTEEGKRVIKEFHQFQEELKSFLNEKLENLTL